MTWNDEPVEFRTTAEQLCTPQELAVLKLISHGYGRRRGSLVLGITPEAWRWRADNAIRKINTHLQREGAA